MAASRRDLPNSALAPSLLHVPAEPPSPKISHPPHSAGVICTSCLPQIDFQLMGSSCRKPKDGHALDFLLEPLSHAKQREKNPPQRNQYVHNPANISIHQETQHRANNRDQHTQLLLPVTKPEPPCTLNHCQEHGGTHEEPSVRLSPPQVPSLTGKR